MKFSAIIKSSSFFGFLFTLFFSIFCLLYYVYFIKKENYFYLDNPSKKIVKVKVNKIYFDIPPASFLKIKLKKGKHLISIQKDNERVKDTFFVVNDVNGVVNPTFSSYYIYKKIYGYRKNKDSIINAQKILTIDGISYKGDIEESKNIIISNFDFGLDESFPTIIHKDSITDRKKIYRKEDFISEFYNLKIE